MTAFYVSAGLMHFLRPRMYFKIMPPWLPYPKELNLICGFAEILLGLLVQVAELKVFATWGLVALLVAVFPANIHMFRLGQEKIGIPAWVLFLRLPLQGVLIYWAISVGSSVA